MRARDEEKSTALRITNQFHSKGGMAYDLKCDGVRLTLLVSAKTRTEDPGEWKIEARGARTADNVAVVTGVGGNEGGRAPGRGAGVGRCAPDERHARVRLERRGEDPVDRGRRLGAEARLRARDRARNAAGYRLSLMRTRAAIVAAVRGIAARRGSPMKDQRVPFIRRALDGVLESLEATLRVRRWTGSEEIPEPLKKAALRLVERLGTADRLAATAFRGTPQDVGRVEAMVAAIRRLDAAYVAFRQSLDRKPDDLEAAAVALTEEIDHVKSGIDHWAAA